MVGAIYNPCKFKIGNHLDILSKCINHYLLRYDDVLLMGELKKTLLWILPVSKAQQIQPVLTYCLLMGTVNFKV